MKQRILIVEDNILLSRVIGEWLAKCGYETASVMDEPSARRMLADGEFDLVLSDVRLPKGNGIALLEWMNRENIHVPFITMTEYASFPDAVRAIKLGACDYLVKPIYREQLLELAGTFLKRRVSVWKGADNLYRRTSPAAVLAERHAKLVAPSDMSVLILGPNGTGKESIARTIHQCSDRHSAPFVAVNCGAIPGELAASLFFGHGKGAFTGADQAKPGYFEMARGGTLFLDEIGTLPYGIQSVLLRVLQEETYIPVGEQKERTADVRIIAATNEDMEQAISERRFREDLYHRISEFEIIQPALKDCPEDILPMADFFRKRFSAELGKRTDGFTREAEAAMLVYHWPGNIRELKNRVKRAVLLSEETLVGMEYLNLRMKEDGAERFRETACCMGTDERQEIVRALQATRGHRKKAAELLGINPATLYRKMNKYGLK